MPDGEIEEVLEDFTCPLHEVESLEEWYGGEDSAEECRPCTLSALASLYLGCLEESGCEEEANRLKEIYKTGDVLTIAREMDKIKEDVEEPVRENLEKLDCFSQTFTEEIQQER